MATGDPQGDSKVAATRGLQNQGEAARGSGTPEGPRPNEAEGNLEGRTAGRIFVIGQVTGFTSYPTVLKGLLRGLAAGGIQTTVADMSAMSREHANRDLEDLDGLEWLDAHETAAVSRGDVPEGSTLLALNPTVHLAKGVQEAGARLVGMHVGDVDRLPAEWIEVMAREEIVCVPSSWMAKVVRRGLDDHDIDKPILVVPHGVSAAMRPPDLPHPVGAARGPSPNEDEGNPEPAVPASGLPATPGEAGGGDDSVTTGPLLKGAGNPVRALHACTAMYYPERKGTPAVLEAFEEMVEEGHDLSLTLLVPQVTKPLKRLLGPLGEAARDRLTVLKQPDGMPADHMAQIYWQHDVLLCPSRAEGFGMMPLEARACGVPVVQTFVTGLRDQFEAHAWCVAKGVVQVPHGEMAPAWGDFGEAPEVNSEMVRTGLRFFLNNRKLIDEGARQYAAEVAEMWAWERVTGPLVTALKSL